MSLCFAAWGFFYAGLHRNGIDYTSKYGITAAYFLLVGCGMAYAFWGEILKSLQNYSSAPLIVLGVFMILQTLWYAYFPTFFRAPTDYFEKYPDRYYLKMTLSRLFSKSMDIFAQQVFIVLLVVFLKEAGLSLPLITLGFFVLFALLHIPLLATEWGAWPSFAFGGVVALFGLVFPALILFVPYGFVYTFILHWLFYTIMGTAFWLGHAELLPDTKKRFISILATWTVWPVPFLLAAVIYGLQIGAIGYALIPLITIVVLMKLRVTMGLRTVRGPLFYIHLMSAVALLALMGVTIYTGHDPQTVLLCLAATMSVTGIMLLWRGMKLHASR